MSGSPHSSVPRVALLGICDGLHDHESKFEPQVHIRGLRFVVASYVYPWPLAGFNIVLASYRMPKEGGTLACRFADGELAFSLTLKPSPRFLSIEDGSDATHPWSVATIPWPRKNFPLILEPGTLHFYWNETATPDSPILIGTLNFVHVKAAPLSEEKLAARRSNPDAAKEIQMIFGCKRCDDSLSVYAALDLTSPAKNKEFTWYKDLPDSYSCKCGRASFSCTYLRENLHGLLGADFYHVGEQITFTRFYETSSLEALHSKLTQLLAKNPDEETVQKFFKENPVLLQQFHAEQIFPKAPILTFFKTDFTILSKTGKLYLIELEAPGKKILKADGGQAAAVTHACDQVRDWQHEFRTHRTAILDSLGLKSSDVSKIQGVVIIGRDEGYDRKHLLRLKSVDRGQLELLTYDDVLANLAALVRELKHVP